MKEYDFIQPLYHEQDVTQVNGFEFRVFLLLDWLSKQGKRNQSTLLFTHNCGRENIWIHIFL